MTVCPDLILNLAGLSFIHPRFDRTGHLAAVFTPNFPEWGGQRAFVHRTAAGSHGVRCQLFTE
jgi:hypothetical protein